MSLLAGMVGGTDSSEDVDRLRHAGNSLVFDGMRWEVGWERDWAAGPRPDSAARRCHSSPAWAGERLSLTGAGRSLPLAIEC